MSRGRGPRGGRPLPEGANVGYTLYDPMNSNDVEILKTRPDKPYVELGTVTATHYAPSESAVMHNAIRAKSAALGATAVILTEEGIIPGGFGGRRWATGVAIRYK